MKIFFSYASIDQNEYKIEKTVDFLEFQDDIKRVFYWERDTKGGESFDDYMRNNIKGSDLVIVLFTPNTKNSVPVLEEIGMSKAFQKHIMPIFDEMDHIVADIQSSRGVKYNPNFRMFCEDLYFKISGKKPKFKEVDPIMEIRNGMVENFKFNKISYVEPELRDVTEISEDDKEDVLKVPLISYRIFKFILFDSLNRGSLNVITAPSGSGKSILLDSLKHDMLHQAHLSSYIPIIVEAKSLKIDKKGLLKEFYNYLLPGTKERYFSNFESVVKSGKVVFLLDGLSKHSHPKELLEKLYDFVCSFNARIIMTCRPIIHEYVRQSSKIKEKSHLYELISFKSSALFEWIVLNKNDYEQTRNLQARSIYLILRDRVKEKESAGERVALPTLMQEFSV